MTQAVSTSITRRSVVAGLTLTAVVKNSIVGQKFKNPRPREWHTKNLGRLPGLRFMRTLWVCDAQVDLPVHGHQARTPLGLEEAHRDLRISPEEFDGVAAELGRTLDYFKVPKREKDEVLATFAATKSRLLPAIAGAKRGWSKERPVAALFCTQVWPLRRNSPVTLLPRFLRWTV